MTAPAAAPTTRASVPPKLFGLVVAGALVSVLLGVYGKVHDPSA